MAKWVLILVVLLVAVMAVGFIVAQPLALTCPPGGTYSAKATGFVLRSDGVGLGVATVNLDDVASGTHLGQSGTSSNGYYSIIFTAGNGKDYRLTASKVGYQTTAVVFSSACTKDIAGYPTPIVFVVSITMTAVLPTTPVVAGFNWLSYGLYVSFGDASTGGPDNWYWNLGDGSPVVHVGTPGLQHQYASAGTYTVSMTAVRSVDGAQDSDSVTLTLTTSSPPTSGGSSAPPPPPPSPHVETNVTDATGVKISTAAAAFPTSAIVLSVLAVEGFIVVAAAVMEKRIVVIAGLALLAFTVAFVLITGA